MRTSTTERTITISELPVEIEYKYNRAYRGARDGRFGPALEPDEPSSVDIYSVYLCDNKNKVKIDITEYISEDEIEELQNELCNEYEESQCRDE